MERWGACGHNRPTETLMINSGGGTPVLPVEGRTLVWETEPQIALLIIIRTEWIFWRILFWAASVIFFFFFFTTITLGKLNQSKPNFHTSFDWNSSANFENGHQRSHGLVFIYIVHSYHTPDSTTAWVSWLNSVANRRVITLLVGQFSFISLAVGR